MGVAKISKFFKQNLKPTESKKQLVKAFAPSAAYFGLAAALAVVYLSDWQVIAGWIPLYNTKFKKPEEEAPAAPPK